MANQNNHFRVKIIVFAGLLTFYALYSLLVYARSTSDNGTDAKLNVKASKGKDLWLGHNCASCHQFYGLGGYLGPDLTNVISTPGKGPDYIKAMTNSGIKQMPEFAFTEEELDYLVEFLRHVDRSGNFPNNDVKMNWYGSFSMKKNNK